jgi:hypothetical protein
MKLDELQEVWRSQDTRIAVRTVLLLDSIREKQKHHTRSIWLRNIREGWVTILAAVYFVCSVESDVESRLQLWPFYSAMAILFGIGVFRVIDNRRQKRRGLEYEDSSFSFVECSLQNIKHRIWLLENIFWWWILPVAVGGILVIAQIIMLVGLQDPTLFWKLGLAAGIACVILGILYWGNRWTARKYWLPRKTELEAIVSALKTR